MLSYAVGEKQWMKPRWNLQNSRWGESHDSRANMRTDKSFISARLSNESFLSYQVGRPSMQTSVNFLLSSCFIVNLPPFHLRSRVSLHSPPLTQIPSGAESRPMTRTHSAEQTKAWHRYRPEDYQVQWVQWGQHMQLWSRHTELVST